MPWGKSSSGEVRQRAKGGAFTNTVVAKEKGDGLELDALPITECLIFFKFYGLQLHRYTPAFVRIAVAGRAQPMQPRD